MGSYVKGVCFLLFKGAESFLPEVGRERLEKEGLEVHSPTHLAVFVQCSFDMRKI